MFFFTQHQALRHLISHIQKPYVLLDSELNIVDINNDMQELLSVPLIRTIHGQNLSNWISTSKQELLASHSAEVSLSLVGNAMEQPVSYTFDCSIFADDESKQNSILLIAKPPGQRSFTYEEPCFILELDTNRITLNKRGLALINLDLKQGDFYLDDFLALCDPQHQQNFKQAISAVTLNGQTESINLTVKYQDSLKLLNAELKAINASEKNILQIKCVLTEISEGWQLKLSDKCFREIFGESSTGLAITDMYGNFVEVNKAYCDMLGYTEDEMLKISFHDLTHPKDLPRNLKLVTELLHGKRKHFLIEKRYIAKGKNTVWVRICVTIQRNHNGNAVRIVGICENITDCIHAEQRLSDLFTNLPGMAYRCRLEDQYTMLFVSPAAENICGYLPADIINNAKTSLFELIHPSDRKAIDKAVRKAVKSGKPYQIEYRIQHADGSERWVLDQGKAVVDEHQNATLLDGYITDITDLKLSALALKSSEQRFQLLSKASSDAIWDWDLKSGVVWWGEGYEVLFGFSRDEIKPTIESWTDCIHTDDRAAVLASLDEFINNDEGITVWSEQYRFRKANGDYAHVVDRAFLIRDENGESIRMVGGMNDITERIQLEEHLRQAQRMESIGQLTGGVAHDFNNLLTVMLGNAEIIADRVKDDANLSGMAEMIISAIYRGSELTNSLLAFARKQPLNPKCTGVNELINKIQPLFFRTLGEHIEIKLCLHQYLKEALVDPGLLENALLNLCLNSRDAMKSGGILTIKTDNIHLDEEYGELNGLSSGDYVLVIVSDTGSGITPETLPHVFEPFFTTKNTGEGTGLGLAMVYGFVKQTGGHIEINSELNQGTTLKLYLPACKNLHHTENKNIEKYSFESLSGDERILLVEDDEMVGEFVCEQLEILGYQVIHTTNGHEALQALKSHSDIDLLFTDVMMPGMSGKQLADKAIQCQPALKILFTSGYTEDEITHHGRLDPEVILLSKPYRPVELARKIRMAIDF